MRERRVAWCPERSRGNTAGSIGSIALVRGGHHATRSAPHHLGPIREHAATLLARSPVTLPIPGTLSLAHLKENLGALSRALRRFSVAALRERVARHDDKVDRHCVELAVVLAVGQIVRRRLGDNVPCACVDPSHQDAVAAGADVVRHAVAKH